MEGQGWRFLDTQAWWDSDDRERLSQATGLHAISPSYAECATQPWWKAFAHAFTTHWDPVAAVAAVGEPDSEAWYAEPAVESSNLLAAFDGELKGTRTLAHAAKWRVERELWKVDVAADDLVLRMKVHSAIRVAARTANRMAKRFTEFALVATPSNLSIRGFRHSPDRFEVPAWGWWPSPIAVDCDLFIQAVMNTSGELIRLLFREGALWVNGKPLEAREI